jgi:hypothetical protein
MRSALYYPHTQIQSESLLKTSLLLWDQVEFLVPDPDYKPSYPNAAVSEAVELIGVQRCPTEDEKRDVHLKLEEFVARDLPPPFYYRSLPGQSEPYEIYPQKLLYDTWRMLEKAQLTSSPLANADYPATDATGLTIMSMLADCCAGETRSRITDRGAAYATITNLLVDEKQPMQVAYDAVVPLTLKTIDLSSISLTQLIRFRKREEEPGGHELRGLRHRYSECVEKHVEAARNVKTRADYAELQRCFTDDMSADLADLRSELGLAGRDLAFSKDIVVSVLTGIAAYAAMAFGLHLGIPTALTMAGTPVAVGGVLGSLNKFRGARKATMQKHAMAYIYELEKS